MPLHISEIGVRMAVSEAGVPGWPARTGLPGEGRDPSGGAIDNSQRDTLIEECVRRVLATLELAERR